MLEITKENKIDYKNICNLVFESFKNAEHTDGNEHILVEKLRKSPCYVPDLSLVAKINKEIVGYIMFTKIKIETCVELALAPLAVLPKYQNKGIGTALVTNGHRIAKNLGYNVSVVLGNKKYYSKFGYEESIKYNIFAPFDIPNENFMAYKFTDKKVCGIVQYPKEFGIENL